MATTDWNYFVEDVCFAQAGLLDCDNTILAPADQNTWLITGILDYEWQDIYDDDTDSVITNASGAKCHHRTVKGGYEKTELTWRRCGSYHPSFWVAAGVREPVYDNDDCLIGLKAPCTSENCRCQVCSQTCEYNGMYMIVWTQAWEACTTGKSRRLRHPDTGDCLWHVDVMPKVDSFRPQGGVRHSASADSMQTDWVSPLEPNPEFGYGPVDADSGEPIIPTNNGEGAGCSSHWGFLTPIPPPQLCAPNCDTIYDPNLPIGDLRPIQVPAPLPAP